MTMAMAGSHPTDGALRAALDGEAASRAATALRSHLEACPACRQRLEALRADDALLRAALETNAPDSPGAAEVGAAWARLRAVWGPERAVPAAAMPAAHRPRRAVPVRAATAGLAAAAVVAAALTVPSVRAAAAGVLQRFRAENVQVVQVSPNDMQAIAKALASGSSVVDIRGLAKMHVISTGPVQTVSASQAGALLNFPLRTLGSAPAGYTLQSVQVHPQLSVEWMQLDVPAIRQLLTSLGNTMPLPADLSQGDIMLHVPASAALTYARASGSTPIHVFEVGNPSLTVSPSSLDVAAVRQILLSLPILPADLRAELEAVNNWQDTAVLPAVPGVSEAVNVDGTQGLYAKTGDPAGDSVVAWLQGGVVYGIEGVVTKQQALDLAATLR